MDDFLLRALAAGLGVALVTGPLGCFVVWRRQAYFGAALAHAALPGVALGILLDLNAAVGVAVVCLLGPCWRRRWRASGASPATRCSASWPMAPWRLVWWRWP